MEPPSPRQSNVRHLTAGSAGDFVHHPSGIAHSFNNTGDGWAKAEVLTTPAGLEGFSPTNSSLLRIVPRRLPAKS